jgi:large subunit ribosomal protein L17
MRHHNKNRVFGRETGQRNALLKSLALALVTHEQIMTTEAKAKELRPFIEKMVTRSKADTVSNRRLISARLGSESGMKKLFTQIGPSYKTRNGGYTRVVKLPARKSDSAAMAVIQFVK